MKKAGLWIAIVAVIMAVGMVLSACDLFSVVKPSAEVTLDGIAVTTAPTKTQYAEGETFDPTGMVVTATYSDGTTKPVTAYTVDKTILSPQDVEVVVTYRDQTAKVTIAVTPKPITLVSIAVATAPTKVQYTKGESFDATGMVVTATYSDGSTQAVTDYTVNKTTLSPQDAQITVTYEGQTATVAITVQEGLSLILSRQPFRSLYVQGECFDATGMLLLAVQDEQSQIVTDYTYTSSPLSLDDSAVTVAYGGKSVDVPVTVVEGTPMVFESSYTRQQYIDAIDQLVGTRIANGNLQTGFVPQVALSEPYPQGVDNLEQFIRQADYFVFYRIASFVIKVNYDYGNIEDLLDGLYWGSELLPSSASVKGQSAADGYVQVVVKYYDSQWVVSDPDCVSPVFVVGNKQASTRTAQYAFATVAPQAGVSVYTSDQAIYALSHGLAIAPVAGSPAETVVNRACDLLRQSCDDSMDAFQKMYNIYHTLLGICTYDDNGDVSAGEYCMDKQYETDMIGSLFTSFYADGALLHGNAVCHGYAKAYALLLGLEGLDVTRVVAQHVTGIGRSGFTYDEEEGYGEFYCHSYLYVTIEGSHYLADVTFAYAGYVPMGYDDVLADYVTTYRYWCLAQTKQQHTLVYNNLKDDRISASASYNPGSFDYLLQYTYDGTHAYACQNTDQADDYWAAVMQTAQDDTANRDFFFTVVIKAECFDDSIYAMRDYIVDKLNEYGVPHWYRRVGRYTDSNGVDYFQAAVNVRLR